MSPRAYSRLSAGLLDALAALLTAAESVGDWPSAVRLILIVLLPKPDGGRHPIGLFHSLVRVWGRARSTWARRWEDQTAHRSHYGSAGRGAQRAAWITAFRAEAAGRSSRAFGQVLLDLAKAFELLGHRAIWEAGVRHGYPHPLAEALPSLLQGGQAARA